MKVHPFDDVVREATRHIKAGHRVHQQFNCAHCGTKQGMETPNVFYERGICEECGKETDIKRDGCNYMLHASRT